MWPLVALVNLPFDWVSLGFTRALLRRGCEADAPLFSPLWLGLLDFVVGAVVLVGLAFALVGALMFADALTWWGGRKVAVDVIGVLGHIRETPGDSANWWVYFTLFSTMVPSVTNCLIGAVSLVTWSWGDLRRWMLAQFSVLDGPGRHGTRYLLVLALSGQVFFGVVLTGLALWGLWSLLTGVCARCVDDV